MSAVKSTISSLLRMIRKVKSYNRKVVIYAALGNVTLGILRESFL